MKSEGQRTAQGELPGEPWWLGLDRKWWVLLAIGMGTYLIGTSNSIINTITSIIMRWYGIDLATGEWIIMIYLVVSSGLLLTFGRLGDMIGHKRVYLLGFVILIAGSLLCAIAPTAPVLIALRGLTAVGASMLFASAPAILTTAFPPRQRGQALGMQGLMTYLGLSTGPALGGFLTTQFGWQSVFLVNLPIGAAAMGVAYLAVARVPAPARGEHFDPPGALTFMAGLTCVLLALSHGQSWGWASAPVLGLLAAGAALLAAFVQIERRAPYPMLDLSLFHARLFTMATFSALMNYLCMYAVTFLTPFYLIQFRGFDPAYAGLLLTGQALAMAIIAPVSGSLSDRIGSRLPATLGMAFATTGILLLSMARADSSAFELVAPLALIGLGTGIFVSPNTSAIMGSVSRQRQGVASAVTAGARNVGMVMGVALVGAVFDSALAASGGTIGPDPAFLPAFRVALLAVAVCGVIGTLSSFSRGSRRA